jgi:serine/threonine protein kinase/predicted ATPase
MIGTRLGSYEIIEEVGKGGMATVYRAYQPNVDRFVALKVIQKSITNDTNAMERFQREARLVARLEHPHILPVYDFDGASDPPYIVMRYLEGGSLKELMKRGPLPLDEIAYLLQQIGAAMDYAHRQGIVHRDLKPSNIMIDRDGNAFVTDFGIARIAAANAEAEHERGITQTGSVIGTPDYMAPEQGMGRGDIDGRADIYSLGVMLFQLITQKLPYSADLPMAIVIKHINDPIPQIAKFETTLSEDMVAQLDRVIRRVLAKDPDDRFKSAADFAQVAIEALGGVISTAPLNLRNAAEDSARLMATRRDEKKEEIRATMASFAAARSKTQTDTDSKKYQTPSEQHKVVTAVYINANDYSEMVAENGSAEAAHQAMSAMWLAFEAHITELGGRIFTRSESSGLALWGAESSREDDPERAVRAAFELQNALMSLGGELLLNTDDEPLPLRIGINTGSVLLTPADKTGSFTATGATINLAMRLTENAQGSIHVAHDTFRYVFGMFDFDPMEPLKLRGRKEKLPVYRATRVRQRVFRMNTRGVEGIQTELMGIQTELIGREAELKQLQNAFFAAFEDNETQVVMVTGDAGIGKSRLLYDFNAWCDLRPEIYRFFQARPTPEMINRPYALLRNMLSYRFEIFDSDSAAVVREKVEAGTADLIKVNDHEIAHLIAYLVGFDVADSPFIRGTASDVQQLVRRARQAFIKLMTTLGHETPVLLLLEDIHWADDASLDLLTDIVSESRDMSLMMLCFARPQLFERRPAWGGDRSLHTHIQLQPLTKRDSRALVKEILQKMEDVPKPLLDMIVERSEGNPYYIEELLKMLIEDHIIQKNEQRGNEVWTVEESRLANLPVPPTLIGLLQARLDSLLFPERIVLQRASAVGRIFWDSAVTALEAGDNTELGDLQNILEKLTEREFINVRELTAFEGAREYNFAQSMLRDVVYDGMISRQQKLYHHLVADWLIANSGERANEYINLVAEHYEHAGELEKASEYLRKAGERALDVSGYEPALKFYRQALALLPPTSVLRRTVLQTRIAEVERLLGDMKAAAQHLNEIIETARNRSDNYALSSALFQLSQVAVGQGEWELAEKSLNESLPLARASTNSDHDKDTLARILFGLGDLMWRMGKSEKSLPYLDEGLQLARAINDSNLELTILNRKGTVIMYNDKDGAMKIYREVLALARECGNRERVAIAASNIGEIYRAENNYTEALKSHLEAFTIGQEIGHIGLMINTAIALGLDEIGAKNLVEARKYLKIALQHGIRLGATSQLLNTIVGFAGVEMTDGKIDRALTLFGLAFFHPASETNVREDAEPYINTLRQQIPQSEIDAGLERGKSLNLDQVVKDLMQ